MKKHRFIMELNLLEFSIYPDFKFREIDQIDNKKLGELLYEADSGTTCNQNQIIDDSINEVQEILSGKYGAFLKECSLIALVEEKLVSATLFTFYEKEQQPLLALTMTHPQYKNMGYCQQLLYLSSNRLFKAGHKTCFLAVDADNLSALAAYKKVGFFIREEEL
jgi:RimJ/RimL family protein N-acetyltransferase